MFWDVSRKLCFALKSNTESNTRTKLLSLISILKPLKGITLSLISKLLGYCRKSEVSNLSFFQSQFGSDLLLEVTEKVILELKWREEGWAP